MQDNATEQELKPFVDDSSFSGMVEYIDAYNKKWRRMNEDYEYHFYIQRGESFHFHGNMKKPKGRPKSIQKIHEMYLEDY